MDAPTHARLAWQYGPERAAEIIAGRDPDTEADKARWRRIGGELFCRHLPETTSQRNARICKLYGDAGVEIPDLAERFGMGGAAITAILGNGGFKIGKGFRR